MLHRLRNFIRMVFELWRMPLEGWAGSKEKRVSLIKALQVSWMVWMK